MKALNYAPLIAAMSLLASFDSVAGQKAVGFRGGVTFASASFDGSFGSEAQTGAIGGGFVTLPVSDRAAVQLEGLYTRRGFSTIGFMIEGAAARMAYLDLPVLLKFRLTPNEHRIRPSVMAGAYWGFELSCTTQGEIVELEQSDSCEGRFRRRGTADVGFILGGNVDYDVTDGVFLLLDGRYAMGVRNMHWEPEADRARSRAWSVMGGFGLRLGS